MASTKRRQWVKPQTPPNSEINVTPLVDVVLVLLIIFMVVTPLLEKDIEVRIPETEQTEQPEEQVDNTQLVVKLDESGALSINTDAATDTEYVERLQRMLAAKKKEDRVVFFVANDKAPYGRLVVAFDGAKRAGAFVLGMATEDIPVAAGGAEGAPAPEGTAPAP